MTAQLASPQLDPDRLNIEAELQTVLGRARGRVAEAMRYAALGGGKRIRPLLSLRIARMLKSESPHVLRAAAAVELLHSASLVVDDLPCMDDERYRRGRASTHIEFGESTALLAAFGLVALAARCVVEVPCRSREAHRLQGFQSRLLRTLDAGELLEGQELDLAELKTGPLFELAVEAGTVSADLPPAEHAHLRAFGRAYGRAFQAMDDFADGDSRDSSAAAREAEAARGCLTPFSGRREVEELLEASCCDR
jgi:geranylgeranyl pyrophosphate synthase